MAAPCNKFTDEQIAELRSNEYVKKVSRTNVYFNDEFKEKFWEMYKGRDMLPSEIYALLGVDSRILGRKRIQGFARNLRKIHERTTGETTVYVRKCDVHATQTPDRQIRGLRAENKYLKQENEFLKKIVSASRGHKK